MKCCLQTHTHTHTHTHKHTQPAQTNANTTMSHRYRRRRFYHSWGWGIGVFSAVSFILLLSIVLSIRYSDNKDTTGNYAPEDTRLLSFSSTFCGGITISDSAATLYLLRETPPLSGPVNNLTASPPVVTEADTYHYLKFHIYSGSKLVMEYCLFSSTANTPVMFYLIKGSDNWNAWTADGSSSHSQVSFSIKNICSSSEGGLTFNYTFTSTDYYYFAFDNTYYTKDSRIKATLFLQRREYVVNNASVVDSCSIFGDSCTVPVPYKSSYRALLRVSNSFAVEENVNIDWSCEPRVWVYTLIVIIPLLFVVAALVFVCVLVVVCTRRKQLAAQGYSAVSTATETQADASAPAVTTTTMLSVSAAPTIPPASAPPQATNPPYTEPPPQYGSTHFTLPIGEPPPYVPPEKM